MTPELIVIGVAAACIWLYVKKPNLGAKAASLTAAARAAAAGALPIAAAPAAKKGVPGSVKMLLGIILLLILILYGGQIWSAMDGMWVNTPPGKYLEAQGAGYSNALWLILLIPVLWYWNQSRTAGVTVAKIAPPKAPRKPLPEWLVWVLILGACAMAFKYYQSSGNVLVNLTGNNQRAAVVTINPADTIEVRLPGGDVDIGGCSVNFGVTPNWRSQHPEVGAVFFDTSGSERGFFQYATLADPLRSTLRRDGTNLEVQVTRSCTVGG